MGSQKTHLEGTPVSALQKITPAFFLEGGGPSYINSPSFVKTLKLVHLQILLFLPHQDINPSHPFFNLPKTSQSYLL